MVGQLGSRRGARLDRGRIERGAPPPQERAPVHVDADAVQLDRPLDRRRRDRQQALLIGDADHEQIGRDGVAEQRGRQPRALDDASPGRRPTFRIARFSASAGRLKSALRVKSPVIISCALTTAWPWLGRQRRERLLAAGDHQIAAQQQLRAAGRDAHGLDVVRARRDAQVAEHRAALLGEAGHVEHGGALALEMRRHAEQRADGDHAGAADPADHDAVALGQRGQRGLGQRPEIIVGRRLRAVACAIARLRP